MKYMIMMFGSDYSSFAQERTPEWIREMIAFMHGINDELIKAGELVVAEGLADGSQAKTVVVRDGVPVVTDGPYAESKESLAGFWIVDVDAEARAIEVAARVAGFIECPVEVRRVPDQPPEV